MRKEDLPPLDFSPSPDKNQKSYSVVRLETGGTQVIPNNLNVKTLLEHEELLKEKFPRIYYQIKAMWGTQEAQDRMTQLIWVDDNERSGFPSEVLLALMTICVEHGEMFGLKTTFHRKDGSQSKDTW